MCLDALGRPQLPQRQLQRAHPTPAPVFLRHFRGLWCWWRGHDESGVAALHHRPVSRVCACCLSHVPELPLHIKRETYDSCTLPVQQTWKWAMALGQGHFWQGKWVPRSALLFPLGSCQSCLPLLLTLFVTWLSLCWFSATFWSFCRLLWKRI